jgi:hypothetical protein
LSLYVYDWILNLKTFFDVKNVIKIIYQFYLDKFTVRSLLHENSGFHARAEIERIKGGYSSDKSRLELYGFKVYSQNDEDGIIEEILSRLNIAKGIFCEIGVSDGLECNSLYLLHKGWKGIWIEGNKRLERKILDKFSSIISKATLGVNFVYATPTNINHLINDRLNIIGSCADDLDFLSIDVDGMDIHLLDALTLKPKVICIEYNSKFPPNIHKSPKFSKSYSWKGTDYMGASLLAINLIAQRKGYELVATNITGANAFFVRVELLNKMFNRSGDVPYLYNPPRYYLINHFFNIGHKSDFGNYEDL